MIGCPRSDSPDRSRRRRWYSQSTIVSESLPLEVDIHGNSPNYSTFDNRQNKQQQDLLPSWWLLLTKPWSDSGKRPKHHRCLYMTSPGQSLYRDSSGRAPLGKFICSTKVFCYSVLFCACLTIVYHNHKNQDPTFYHHHPYSAPQSHWDHNVYAPYTVAPLIDSKDKFTSTTQSTSASAAPNQRRAFLVAQLTGRTSSLGSLTDITSRPNRAYARQHGMDYVRYARGGKSHTKTCFDKVILLNTILDNQLRDTDQPPVPSIFSLPPRIEYDAVALLPPDSIITNLDCNIFDALPRDKLVAIAGWTEEDDDASNGVSEKNGGNNLRSLKSATDVMFFNLRHKHANAVAKLWWDLVEPKEVTCGAGNDLNLLVDAISFVIDENEDLSSLILPLDETDDGFVMTNAHQDNRNNEEDDDGDVITQQQQQQERVIKGITPSLPESRAYMLLSNLPQAKVELQTTADSVCYRYYPRCEVL